MSYWSTCYYCKNRDKIDTDFCKGCLQYWRNEGAKDLFEKDLDQK